MKKLFLFLLCVCSGAYALPPVVDNSSYSGGSAYSASAPSNNSMFEVLDRLEQLQKEIQQLRGVVEEQSQTIVDLKKRQGNIYSDLDQRIQELSGQGGERTPSGTDAEGQTDQFEMNNSVNDSATEQNTDQYEMPDSDNSNTTNVTSDLSTKSEKERYQVAYEKLRNGHNTYAISAFKSFLIEFPNGEYADNSMYWLGEAYKANKDFTSAKAVFTKITTQFSGSPKVPDALLKLGYIELELGNTPKAKDYLTQVTVNYPGTPAANLAAEKLMQLGVMQP